MAFRGDDPTEAFTGTLYVTEEKQRELLLTKIVTICKEKGIKTLDAPLYGDLLKQKDQLIKLFESLGFTQTGTTSYYEKKI